MEIQELIKYVIPSLVVAISIIFVVAYRLVAISTEYKDYKNDVFRHSVEKQIAELSMQLGESQERFKSINHLLIDAQNVSKKAVEKTIIQSDFFNNMGVNKTEKIDNKLIFVLTPFNQDYYLTYLTVKRTVEDLGLKCSRGDDAIVSHNILEHIIQQMVKARMIVANISGRNPNVFYELGIAHALGKPVLLTSETDSSIPFDLSHIRTLIYKDEKQLSEGLKSWLVSSLAEKT
jgi:hypothetical protein